jgi:glycosyltransferase involved in cell wall biosynthesis
MDLQIQKPDLWIIVDNSTNENEDWSISEGTYYERVKEKKPIGWLRNRCLEIALQEGADYIVFWDDDDYYPPTRISSSIQALEANPEADISGTSLMYLLLTRENVLMTTGPFHDHHCTGATMTIRRRYAENNRFDPEKLRGEEVTFTKNWTAKVVQLRPEDVIVVMGHSQNTVDKSDLLRNPKLYCAKIVNDINGKMVFRARWPVQWDLWKSTFFGGGCDPLQKSTPSVECQSVVLPTLSIEDTEGCAEHRV